MSLKTAIFLLAALWGIGWYVKAGMEAREADEEKKRQHQQQLAFSTLTPEVIKSSTEALYSEIKERIDFNALGIVIFNDSPLADGGGTTIISKNTPYVIYCSDWIRPGVITVSFGSYEDAPGFELEKFRDNLPFLPDSVAGKKLNGILCERVASLLHAATHGQKQ